MDIGNLKTQAGTVELSWQIELRATPEDQGVMIDKVMEIDWHIYDHFTCSGFHSAVGRENFLPE